MYGTGLNMFSARYRRAVSRSASAVEASSEVKFCKNLNIVRGSQPYGPLRHKKYFTRVEEVLRRLPLTAAQPLSS